MVFECISHHKFFMADVLVLTEFTPRWFRILLWRHFQPFLKKRYLTWSSSNYIFYHLLHNSFEETVWKVHFQIYENQEHFAKLKRGESFKLVRLGLTGWITLISNNSNSAQNGADFIWYPEMFIFGCFIKGNFQNYTIWNKLNLGKDQKLTHT